MVKMLGSSVPKKIQKKTQNKELTPLDKAKEAVQGFEERRSNLSEMRAAFEEEYPEAVSALNEIRQEEDALNALAEKIKPLVRDAGTSVGDFGFQARATSATYDSQKILEMLTKAPEAQAGKLIKLLIERGLVKDLAIDRDVAKVLRSTDPKAAEKIEEAWDAGGKPLTAAITTPKF